MRKLLITFFSLALVLLAPATASAAIVVDHTKVSQFESIPQEWINAAKANLKIAYGHTSHGSQLITGMNMLVSERGSLYAWNNGGTSGALDVRDYYTNFGGLGIANDLGAAYNGSVNRTAWEVATRLYLNQHPEVNVIIWSWCWQMPGTEAEINLYLNLMHQLEHDFPSVKFVYMTGHVTAGQILCNDTRWICYHNLRATQIRNFVNANNGTLYDFADIESYDPSGNYYGDKLVDDACNYDSNGDNVTDSNWATNWCAANSCLSCAGCAHSHCLNCYMKGKTAWWLWARLAGWSGTTNQTCTDNDGDSYGVGCVSGADCNDNNASIRPGATEVCNGVDDDCDSSIDEGVRSTYYRDVDGDSYGNLSSTQLACSVPSGYVSTSTDCNDNNASIRPGATEICNGVDDDCDGSTDEGFSLTTYYRDADNDTYGSSSVTIQACVRPSGYVNNSNDCNDGNSNIRPGATEICGNSIDEDCSGADLTCGGGGGGTYALPVERSIEWDAGIPGGIPSYPVGINVMDYGAVGDGVTDDTAAINAAIAACPEGQAVLMPAGTYRVSGTLTIDRGIAVRGEGWNRTRIIQYSSNHLFMMVGSLSAFYYTAVQWHPETGLLQNITSGGTKGTTSVTITDATQFSVGDVVYIDQLNDPTLVNQTGYGTCTWCGLGISSPGVTDGSRAMGELLIVQSKSGNILTFNHAFYHNYQAQFLPRAIKISGPARRAGVEDLYVGFASGLSNGASFYFNGCAHCWVKNVESYNCPYKHVDMEYTYGAEVRDSYFHESQFYDGNRGYGIGIRDSSTSNLFENNVFYHLHNGIILSGGGVSGNVIAYNYLNGTQHYQPSWFMWNLGTHGAHTYMTLFESNIADKIVFDSYWGSGSHNVAFRNFITRENSWVAVTQDIVAVIIDKLQYYCSFVGNVLGKIGCQGPVEQTPFLTNDNNPVLWKIGFMGSELGNPSDPKTNQTLIRHGNWQCPTNAVQWDPSISEHTLPNSLYLSSKPSWFGNLPWPAIGPDVTPMNGTLPAKARFQAIMSGNSCPFYCDTDSDGDLECNSVQCSVSNIPGDINGNSVVDINDLVALVIDFGKTSGFTYARADTNSDGTVDIFDLSYVGSRLT